MTKSIDNLTFGEIKELLTIFADKKSPSALNEDSVWQVGENYLIRTVTMIQIGRLEKITDKELLLSSAAWIADTGRFYDALKSGKLNEVEPFPNDVIIGRGSIIDATQWQHKIKDWEQK